MEKLFNFVSVIGGVVGGTLIALLGGWDQLIIALIILMVLDYITGVLQSIYNKELSSKIGFKGLLKKVLILCVVAVSVVIEKDFGVQAVREVVIMFFACNEGISVLEKATKMGIPLPKKLQDVLLQIKDK